MPRLLKRKTARQRVESARKISRRPSTAWVDPFPHVHGTLPEKMVYAELTRLGIPFYFLNDIHFVIPEIGFDQYYQVDFVIPSIKVVIEVQGAYWHTMPDRVESDAFKFAIYENAGYHVIAWWDFDILSNLHNLFIQEERLISIANITGRSSSTELAPIRRTKVDTSQGIRTLNSRRKQQKSLVRRKQSVRKAKRTRLA